MNNLQVINNFLNKRTGKTPTRDIINGYYIYKGNTLTSTGTTLINYNTIIATWENDIIKLNMKKYSRTTSKIQSQLLNAITQYNINYKIEE